MQSSLSILFLSLFATAYMSYTYGSSSRTAGISVNLRDEAATELSRCLAQAHGFAARMFAMPTTLKGLLFVRSQYKKVKDMCFDEGRKRLDETYKEYNLKRPGNSPSSQQTSQPATTFKECFGRASAEWLDSILSGGKAGDEDVILKKARACDTQFGKKRVSLQRNGQEILDMDDATIEREFTAFVEKMEAEEKQSSATLPTGASSSTSTPKLNPGMKSHPSLPAPFGNSKDMEQLSQQQGSSPTGSGKDAGSSSSPKNAKGSMGAWPPTSERPNEYVATYGQRKKAYAKSPSMDRARSAINSKDSSITSSFSKADGERDVSGLSIVESDQGKNSGSPTSTSTTSSSKKRKFCGGIPCISNKE